jgi:PcRGLX-like protein central beta sandwich domain/PcRGLX-like N-terminal RIFT barrel domain
MLRIALLVVVASVALGLTSSSLCGEKPTPIVTLTVEDEGGLGAVNHPVTMGVPFPEGKVAKVEQLVLLDAGGKRLPCGAREVTRWMNGKSVKWVHFTWLQSVGAKGRTQVTVAALPTGSAAPKAVTPLTAVKQGNKVTVQTGFVKFVVKGAKFNGFDSAWFDPSGKNNFAAGSQIIGGAGGGSNLLIAPKDAVTLKNEHPKITGKTKAFSSTGDAEGKVEIEESGPFRVVIKATGRHMAGDERALDYTVRFYAYANSPLVRVSHVFVSRQGERAASFHWMAGLNFDLPTRLAGGKLLFGSEAAPVATGAPAAVYQDTSDHFAITSGQNQLAEGKGKSTKPKTTGWVDLRKGSLGLAAGVKWFWQMRPKRLSVDAQGMIKVGLYATGARPLEVYRGQSRTHYMTFVFHNGQLAPAKLNAIYAGEQKPLRAWAPPKYYCRDARPFGPIAENDKALFGEHWAKVQKHNDIMFRSLQALLRKVDGNTYGPKDHPVTRDSYGIYAWGDRYHWAWKNFGESPVKSHQWRQSWAGNYYDYPYAMITQFMRTGEKLYLERFWSSAVQIGDVHTTNWHPRKSLCGACRYCPPRNFVAFDGGKVMSSVEFNHYKAQSVYAHYYFTGDLRSLEHCRLLANNALLNHAADSGWAARGVGHQMSGLHCAYELWRDPKYFKRMKGMAYKAMAQFKRGKYRKGGFHDGIANEGLCYYYMVSGDQKVIDTFKQGLPKSKSATRYPNMAFSIALTYRVTGEAKYRDMAWKVLLKKKVSSRVHGPATQYRGNPYALFLLSDISKNWKPYTGPLGDGKGPDGL